MDYQEKQNELDAAKWEKSQRLGIDACGTFNFCSKCNKSLDHPCARAWEIYEGLVPTTRIEKPVRLMTDTKVDTPNTQEETTIKVETNEPKQERPKAKSTKSVASQKTKSTKKATAKTPAKTTAKTTKKSTTKKTTANKPASKVSTKTSNKSKAIK